MRFLGTIEAKTDAKGRAFLPAAFRKMLGAKKNPTPEDQEAIRMVASSFSKAERENLRELEAYLREGK
mgnify:CR=1 FL=1